MDIKFKITGIDEALKALSPERMKKVVTRTINKTAAQANTALGRKVREAYNVKAKDFNAKVRVIKAKTGERVAIIRVTDRHGLPLITFGARQTKKGVTYQVRRDQGRKLMVGAFVANMKSGHKGVFMRQGNKRLPINEQYRTDAVGMVSKEGVAAMETVINEKMQDIFDHELQYELSR